MYFFSILNPDNIGERIFLELVRKTAPLVPFPPPFYLILALFSSFLSPSVSKYTIYFKQYETQLKF